MRSSRVCLAARRASRGSEEQGRDFFTLTLQLSSPGLGLEQTYQRGFVCKIHSSRLGDAWQQDLGEMAIQDLGWAAGPVVVVFKLLPFLECSASSTANDGIQVPPDPPGQLRCPRAHLRLSYDAQQPQEFDHKLLHHAWGPGDGVVSAALPGHTPPSTHSIHSAICAPSRVHPLGSCFPCSLSSLASGFPSTRFDTWHLCPASSSS